MFSIKLVDIGGDGLIAEFDSRLETLAEVEVLVKSTVNQHLHITNAYLEHNEDLVFSVMVNGREVGVAVIRSL